MERTQAKHENENNKQRVYVPILTPRHVSPNVTYSNTPYALFDPQLYVNKFPYPAKEPPKYW